MTPNPYSAAPHLRAGDADRDAVLAELSEHFQAGRLTSDEFEDRSSRALVARTMGDLAELMTDLPRSAPRPPLPAQPTLAGPPLAPLVAVFVALVVVTSAVTVGNHYHGWTVWWIIPLVLLIVRRIAWRQRNSPGQAGRRPGDWGDRE